MLKLDGENELAILVRGDVVLMREDYVDRYDPDAWIENDAHRDYPPTDDNVASPWARSGCAAARGPRACRRWRVPDVERANFSVFSRVQNARNAPCAVELRYAVSQEGKPVPDAAIPAQKPCRSSRAKRRKSRLRGTGRGLRPYTPAQPILVKLSTSVVEDGKTVDVEIRFGYRGESQGLRIDPQRSAGHIPRHGAQHLPASHARTARPWPVAAAFGLHRRNGRIPLSLRHEYLAGIGVGTAQQRPLLAARSPVGHGYYLRMLPIQAASAGTSPMNATCTPAMPWGAKANPNTVSGSPRRPKKSASPSGQDLRFLSDGNGNLGGRLNFTSWHYMNQGWSSGYGDGDRTLTAADAKRHAGGLLCSRLLFRQFGR